MVKEGILQDFLGKHGREAVGMMFRELTQEEAMEMSRQDGYALGVEKGIERGRHEGLAEGEASGRASAAKAMKNEGIDINTIVKVSGLSAEEIEKL